MRPRLTGHKGALISVAPVVALMRSEPRSPHLSRQQHRALIRSLEDRAAHEKPTIRRGWDA